VFGFGWAQNSAPNQDETDQRGNGHTTEIEQDRNACDKEQNPDDVAGFCLNGPMRKDSQGLSDEERKGDTHCDGTDANDGG
jgi:hypothetical protein